MTPFPRLGAIAHGDEVTHTVWAPTAELVELVTETSREAMGRADDGTWTVTRPGGHGDRYRFRIDATHSFPDPMSWAQPEGVLGPSAVFDPAVFPWTGSPRTTRPPYAAASAWWPRQTPSTGTPPSA